MSPHRTVGNSQAAEFDSTLSLLPNLPYPLRWNTNEEEKGKLLLKKTIKYMKNIFINSLYDVCSALSESRVNRYH